MKTLKKSLAVALVVIMLLSCVPLNGFAIMDWFALLPQVGEEEMATDGEASVVDSGACGNNLTWTFYDDGLLVIEGKGEMWDYSVDDKAPWDEYFQEIIKVEIKQGITSIGDRSFFDCSSIEIISIPDSVMSIGELAFYYCSNLTGIIIPNGVTTIERNTFYYCRDLSSITIPQSITLIGDFAFEGCSSLTDIDIPNSVTSIGNHAFWGCNSLTDVIIPDSVTSIAPYAFDYCASLMNIYVSENNESYSSENGVLFNKEKDKLIKYPMNRLETEYVVPDGVTSLGDQVFYRCTNLTKITLPNSVTNIGKEAFSGCTGLVDINLPNGITTIADETFYDCSSLRNITIPNSAITIKARAFCGCNELTNIVIPIGVMSIEEFGFSGCNTKVTFLNSNCEIYDASYTIDPNATIIGYVGSTAQAYAEKYDIEFIAICEHNNTTDREAVAATCTSVGYTAGTYCEDCEMWIDGHEEVAKLEHIDTDTDYVCDACDTPISDIEIGQLKQVIVDSGLITMLRYTPTVSGKYAFSYATSALVGGSGDVWGDSASPFALSSSSDSGQTRVYGYIFDKEMNLLASDTESSSGFIVYCDLKAGTTYYLGTRYASDTDNGVYNVKLVCVEKYCDHINTTAYEEVVTTCAAVGYTAGTYCEDCEKWIEGHEEVIISHTDEDNDTVCDVCGNSTAIANGVCGDNLTWTLYDDGLLVIEGEGEMNDYDYLDLSIPTPWNSYRNVIINVEIKEGVTSIGSSAFYGCSKMESISIPSTVASSIKYDTFFDCSELRNVVIPYGITSIDSCAFQYSGLTSVVIPDSVISIGASAFHCTLLEDVVIPTSVTSIDNGAFDECWCNITILNPNVEIYDASYTIDQCATIFGYEGSTAQAYAEKYGRDFVLICDHINTTAHEAVVATCASVGYTAGTYCEDCEMWTEGHEKVEKIAHTDKNDDTICDICGNSTAIANGVCGDNLIWTLCDNGLLVIEGEGPMYDYSWDDYIDSLPTYMMWDYDEEGNIVGESTIKKIVVETGATTIGDYAFNGCTALESVEIADTVTSIGAVAFDYCINLKHINIPGSVKTIKEEAFSESGLETIEIQNGLEEIGAIAFLCCQNLKTVEIPESVISVGDYAFLICDKLETVIINNRDCKFGADILMTCELDENGDLVRDENGEWVTIECKTVLKGHCGSTAEEYAINSTNDGYSITFEPIAHSPLAAVVENEVAPKCEAAGSYDSVVYCELCGGELSRETVSVEALTHSFTTYTETTAPKCGVEGEETAYCDNDCGATNKRAVKALAHTPLAAVVENEVAPKCEAAGSYDSVVYCELCGDELSRETVLVEALSHQRETVAGKVATCTETGLTDGIECSVCGKTIVAQEVIGKLYHKDENGDYLCDYGCGHEFERPTEPDTPDEPTGICDHLCHQTGFKGFIWKIVCFFLKLFKMNPVCDCGVAHY